MPTLTIAFDYALTKGVHEKKDYATISTSRTDNFECIHNDISGIPTTLPDYAVITFKYGISIIEDVERKIQHAVANSKLITFFINFLILLTKILVGPVGVTFTIVKPDFQLLEKRSEKDVFDPDPIGSSCEGRDPNHAVTIVGYAKDGLQGKDYW
jgi:hypothetical protein